MQSVYIQGGLRTPIGIFHGQYKVVRPEFLGAHVLTSLWQQFGQPIERNCQRKFAVQTETSSYATNMMIICGNAVGTGGNIGRLAALYADIPNAVPACTIDMQCASAAAAIEYGMARIQSGLSTLCFVGGIESASLQPMRTYADGDNRSGSYKVAQFSPSENDYQAMLWGAERTAQKWHITHAEMAPWIIRSHQLAAAANNQQLLKNYIVSYQAGDKDESIRPRMSERLLRRMPPLLGPDSVITAGNSCLTHDGAAFLVLSPTPSRFRLVTTVTWGGNPLYSPEGAWLATEALLQKTGLTMEEISTVEWNEAFAVIDVLYGRHFPGHEEKYNRIGGALAYGHPYGCSGAMLVLHCMASLDYCEGHYGVCAIAGAGGTGVAMLIERVSSL